jgi:hypothetical protein
MKFGSEGKDLQSEGVHGVCRDGGVEDNGGGKASHSINDDSFM